MFKNQALTVGKTLLVLLALLSAGFVSAAVEDEVRARIQPYGDVCVMGEACAAAVSSVATAAAGPKQPDQVYQTYCFACHATGVNNAPIRGDAVVWAPRIAKGMAALYENAINGYNNGAMPVKGLCMDCTPEEIQATVDLMVQDSQ